MTLRTEVVRSASIIHVYHKRHHHIRHMIDDVITLLGNGKSSGKMALIADQNARFEIFNNTDYGYSEYRQSLWVSITIVRNPHPEAVP